MADEIGTMYNTAIPSFAETADIQEAFRIYHYGANSGTGPTEYDTSNSDPTNLKIPSIAYHLWNLQDQITNFEAGVLGSAWTEKGAIMSAAAPGEPTLLPAGENSQVLRINTATDTGLEWEFPEVSLINEVTLYNKTLATSNVSYPGVTFLGPDGNDYSIRFGTDTPTANRVINLPNVTGKVITTGNLEDITGQIAPTAPFTVKSASGVVMFNVSNENNGNLELGRRDGTASTPYIDFHAGSTDVDFDARIVATDGNGVSGGGTLKVIGNLVNNVNPVAKTGTYVLQPSDYNTVIQMNAAAAFQVTTSMASAPVGTQITLLAQTTGVSVTAINSTLRATPGTKLRTAWSIATLICIGYNTWILTGDLSV